VDSHIFINAFVTSADPELLLGLRSEVPQSWLYVGRGELCNQFPNVLKSLLRPLFSQDSMF